MRYGAVVVGRHGNKSGDKLTERGIADVQALAQVVHARVDEILGHEKAMAFAAHTCTARTEETAHVYLRATRHSLIELRALPAVCIMANGLAADPSVQGGPTEAPYGAAVDHLLGGYGAVQELVASRQEAGEQFPANVPMRDVLQVCKSPIVYGAITAAVLPMVLQEEKARIDNGERTWLQPGDSFAFLLESHATCTELSIGALDPTVERIELLDEAEMTIQVFNLSGDYPVLIYAERHYRVEKGREPMIFGALPETAAA